MSITKNLERSYNLFIEQEDSLAFFRGLAEYADYVLTISVLKDVVDSHISQRNTLYAKIEDTEKKAIEEMEQVKQKLFTIIKRKKIDASSFKRFVTHGYGNPLIKNAIDDLDAYEKKEMSKSGWYSDTLEHCLFDIAVNIKVAGYESEISEFLASTDEYIEYYQRINGPSQFLVSGNENGTFIFSPTWPDRFQAERILKSERQLKPWGAFEELLRFKEAYDTVSRNESFSSIFKHESETLSEVKDDVEIIFMATDLERLIENESRYRHSPANIELEHLKKRVLKTQMQTVHNRLMRRATEHDNDLAMMKKVEDEQNKRRDSYILQGAAPYSPIQLGVSYNLKPEPTPVIIVKPVEVEGLKNFLKNQKEKGVKISLAQKIIKFDEAKPAILIDKKICPLPPAKNEDYFSKAMFSRPIGEFVDWSTIYQEMTGTETIPDKNKERSVRDTMDRLNERIQEVISTGDQLFSWENRSIRRNY